MTALLVVMTCLPLLGTAVALSPAKQRVMGAATATVSVATLAAAIGVAASFSSLRSYRALDYYVYLDPLSVFFCVTVAIVIALAGFASNPYIRAEADREAMTPMQVRLFHVAFGMFATFMLAALESGNLGLVWVLVEAATLSSAVLVGLEAKPGALEAAWKYVIISSLGVTIALVGTIYVSYSASGLHLATGQALAWPVLLLRARALQPEALRLGFLLGVVGYGTKVGLVPMHTWLPDAHAEAPSPASAMLSGAILNLGMYAVIRFRAIARAGLGPSLPDHTLLVFGFASIALGAIFMVRSGSFKRLFAYSSVEQMGIIAVALGFGGPLGLFGALLQLLNHAIGKSVLFLASGAVVLGYKTREIGRVAGMLSSMPVTGAVMLLASLAVLGSPPFGIFIAELTILRAGFQSATAPWLPLLMLALFALAFIAFLRNATGMVTGNGPGTLQPYGSTAMQVAAGIPLVAGMVALLLLGLWVPSGLGTLILRSTAVMR